MRGGKTKMINDLICVALMLLLPVIIYKILEEEVKEIEEDEKRKN